MKTIVWILILSFAARWAGAQGKTQFEKELQFVPKDPWRVIGGKTNYAKGDDWVHFRGRVLEVQKDGVRLQGWYGNKFQAGATSSKDLENDFFIAHFPQLVAEGDRLDIDRDYTAKTDGTHTYPTPLGGSRTIQKLEYGKICAPPEVPKPNPGKMTAAEAAAAEKRAKLRAAELKHHQELAAKGDAYGQFRMGERYLKGDGVEENLTKARQLLNQSAAQGNADAAALLNKISARTP